MAWNSAAVISALLFFSGSTVAQSNSTFQIFANGTVANSTLVPLTTVCINAMQATIQCDGYLQGIAASDYYFINDSSTVSAVCTKPCAQSLASYHNSVTSACAGQGQAWAGYPNSYFGDILWASYNMTCLTDPKSGTSCMSYFSNLTASLTADMEFSSLPKTQLCSGCSLALWQLMQGTAYSYYDSTLVSEWASIQQTCGVSFPTAVQSNPTNVTNLPGFAPANYSVPSCFSGNTYNVVSGDNCVAISQKQNVSTGALIGVNYLLPDCSNLFAGATLCLPNTCQTYTVNPGDTCAGIINSTSISLTQFLAWNPSINDYCTNLVAGQEVCIGLPGTAYSGTTIAGATVTQTAVYATATVTPPNNVAHGTTASCGKYYTVVSGDDCSLIALNQTISISLFEAINPSVNANCTNLVPNIAYCVSPTADWNTTSTNTTTASTYASAPAPTVSGTPNSCYEWHTVVSGDYCGLLESEYGITFAQFQMWNPSIDAACDNLILGDAYCVNGFTSPSGTATPVTATATPAAKSAATSTRR